MNEVIFSHRPRTGVSVAASSDGNKLFFAIALTNDGVSRNSILHEDRRDSFSRDKARNILRGRIEALVNGRSHNMGAVYETALNARDFMARFRETFKPDVEENDVFLCQIESFSGIDVRYRASANDIIDRLFMLADKTVYNVQAKV